MILRSVELESFGRFKNCTIEFRRGINLVIGPNEAGKSTLAEAVPAVLFGTGHLEKYKTWGRNACAAALFFEGGGRTIQVRRDLLTDEVGLVEKDDMYNVLSSFTGKAPLRGRSASCREYRELVASLLGVGDERLFRATYFFGHQPQEWSGDELAQNLRTLVSGTAEADYAEILDELLEEHFNLTCSNPWGRDKQKLREYEELCQKIEASGETGAVPVFVELDSSAEIRDQADALSAELIHDRLEYEKGLKYVDHVRRQVAATSETSQGSQQVAPENSDSAELTGSADIQPKLVAAGLPSDPPRELPELLEEATQIRQEMAELQQPYSALNSREKKVPVVPWLALGIVVLLCLASGVLSWWFDLYAQWVITGAAIVTIAVLGWGGWRQVVRKKLLAECKQQRNRLDREKLAAQSKQTALSERCEALGLPSSPIDLVRLQKLVAAHRDLLDIYWQGPQDRSAAPDQEEPKDPTVQEGRPKVENFVELADENEELKELEARMSDFAEKLKAKEARLADLRERLSASPQGQSTEISTESQNLYQRKRELEDRIAVLRKSVDLLAGSVDEFSRSHLVKLTEEAGRIFSKITSGRYKDIRLDENMLPSVKIDGRRWVSADSFSRGTVDAIYLALRVALAKVRDDGRSLPLMLDDPFVHLDQKRLTKALNAIDLASADGQLILFSHNMELGKRAARERWHVVSLDGDTVDTNTEEEGGEHAGQLHLL